jgi:MFS family permease
MMSFLVEVRKLGRAFIFLSASQAIFVFGALVLEFGLGVWVFQQTGSVLDFSTVLAATILPHLLLFPLAGAVADRVDRRRIVLVADVVCVVATGILAALVSREGLRFEHIIAFNVSISMAGAFRAPAAQALIATLIPPEQLSRASGIIGVGNSLSSILAPTVGGALMVFTGLAGLVWINVVTLIVGSILLLAAFFEIKPDGTIAKSSTSIKMFDSVRNALSFLTVEPLMGGLLVYMVVQSALVTLASNMLTPLVLSQHTAKDLGLILTCGTIGAAAGSTVLIVTGQKNRLMISILLCDALLALCIVGAGVVTSVVAYCICVFMALFASGFAGGCAEALWMRKAHVDRRGSIFSLVDTVGMLVTVLVTVGGGLVVDRVFSPALGQGGVLERWMGWLTSGEGRAIALVYLIAGSLGFVVSILALAQVRMRNVDVIVPDARSSVEMTT